jgi:hypothetical protein
MVSDSSHSILKSNPFGSIEVAYVSSLIFEKNQRMKLKSLVSDQNPMWVLSVLTTVNCKGFTKQLHKGKLPSPTRLGA